LSKKHWPVWGNKQKLTNDQSARTTAWGKVH